MNYLNYLNYLSWYYSNITDISIKFQDFVYIIIRKKNQIVLHKTNGICTLCKIQNNLTLRTFKYHMKHNML